MSAAEVTRMKATLRFLREHRNALKLKVNAAEDLLLNGRREPTHRGLCQHLLSKLDRARVLQAAAHMPPAQATEFLGGIVRFKPEVPYLIEFLRSVKASAHPRQAAAALTQALELLDFAETSSAQMRDLLQLVVDVFPRSELPVFMFSLLSGSAFRSAFDRSSEVWPASLAELLLPLRSLHRSLRRHGARRDARGEARLSVEQVRAGAMLMLGASRESLHELPEPLRKQLLAAGSDALGRGASGEAGVAAAEREAARAAGAALVSLFNGLEWRDGAERATAVRALAGALLRASLEAPARTLLQAEAAAAGEGGFAAHWLGLLSGPRLGNLALEVRSRRSSRRRHRHGPAEEPESSAAPPAVSALASERWQRAFHLSSQREALVRVADAAAPDALQQHAELRRRALVPGIAPVLEQGRAAAPLPESGPRAQASRERASSEDVAYLALLWQGPPLARRLQDADVEPELVLGWCAEACRLLAALAAQGLALPDASLQRFSVDASQRLWLVDLWGLSEGPPVALAAAHLELARGLCREVLGAHERELSPVAAARALDSAGGFVELLAALAAAE